MFSSLAGRYWIGLTFSPNGRRPWKVSSCWGEFNGARASKIMEALFKPLRFGLLKRAISMWGYNGGQGQRRIFCKGVEASVRQGNPPGEFTFKQPHITMAMRRKLGSGRKAKKGKQNVVIMLNGKIQQQKRRSRQREWEKGLHRRMRRQPRVEDCSKNWERVLSHKAGLPGGDSKKEQQGASATGVYVSLRSAWLSF